MPDDAPRDPFDGDPADPAAALGDDDEPVPPLVPSEREQVLADLEDLEVFEALLAPRGMLGLAIDCEECKEPHYFSWQLLRANLRHLLDSGATRVHEPAYGPDPSRFVTWDYARGFVDGVLDADPDDD